MERDLTVNYKPPHKSDDRGERNCMEIEVPLALSSAYTDSGDAGCHRTVLCPNYSLCITRS